MTRKDMTFEGGNRQERETTCVVKIERSAIALFAAQLSSPRAGLALLMPLYVYIYMYPMGDDDGVMVEPHSCVLLFCVERKTSNPK